MFKKDLIAPLIFLFILILSLTGCLKELGEEEGVLPEPEGSVDVEEPSFADADGPISESVLVTAYSVDPDLMLAVGYNPPILLTEGYGDFDPLISPDGEKILFKRPADADQTSIFPFELWVINADGSNFFPLVTFEDLPGEEGELFDSPDPVVFDRLPLQIGWLNDSSAILFNTQLKLDRGQKVYNDLWQVFLEEPNVNQVLDDGMGGSFALSPDGEVLLVAGIDYVAMLELETNEYNELLRFPFVNTASESPFLPMPSWAPDSSYGLIAIPDPEPYNFDGNLPELAIWMLPRTGEAQMTALVYGYNLGDAMSGDLISPDGSHFAYGTGDFPNGEVRIASLDGQVVNTFSHAYDFLGWSTNGAYLILYADSPYLGGLHIEERELDTHDEVFGWSAVFKWVGPATYVGLDFSYFLEESILWVTEIGGDSRIIDLRVSSFDARLQ